MCVPGLKGVKILHPQEKHQAIGTIVQRDAPKTSSHPFTALGDSGQPPVLLGRIFSPTVGRRRSGLRVPSGTRKFSSIRN